jgi:SynChlorMet cassette radical SAM/SPASM protein ScmF
LLHPQIREILAIVKNEGLGLTVETNGLLCTQEICQLIADCKKPFVSVSLDAANAEVHEKIRGVKGCFEQALCGTRNLVKAGLRPQIIMTVMRSNKREIEPLVDLAKSLGAGSLKINIVQPTARGQKMHRSGQTLSVEELVEMGEWAEGKLAKEKKFRIIFSHPHAFQPLSRMFGSNANNCGICRILNIIGVLGNGMYALCGIGETVPELVFGDARTAKLEDVWNNNPVLNELRAGLPSKIKGICAECLMRGICLGSCIAQNYFLNKDLWSPFWYCQQAHEKGLFPKTRLRSMRQYEISV